MSPIRRPCATLQLKRLGSPIQLKLPGSTFHLKSLGPTLQRKRRCGRGADAWAGASVVNHTAEQRLEIARLGDCGVDRMVRRVPADLEHLREAIDVP